MNRMLQARMGLALFLVAGAFAIIFTAANPWLAAVSREPRQVAFIGGIEAPLSLAELAAMSDIIVIGTGTSERVTPFTHNPAVPAEDRDPRVWAKASYREVTFNVAEYLKGSGAPQINLRSHASSPSFVFAGDTLPDAKVGTSYVLFLERGRGVWTGGYTVLGSRGIGEFIGSGARFVTFGDVSIATLRRTAAENAQPPRRR